MIFKTVDQRGRVTLPYELRTKLGWCKNSVVSVREQDGGIFIKPEKICANLSLRSRKRL